MSSDQKQSNKFKIIRYGLSAMNASLLSQTLLYPLDVLKTRYQSHDGRGQNLVPKYQSTWDAFKRVYQDEGIRGFYRGLITTISATAVNKVIFITMFEMRKQYYKNLGSNFKKQQSKLESFPLWKKLMANSDTQNTLAAIESGILSTSVVVATMPFFLIKTRLMLQCERSTSGTSNFKNCVKEIYEEHGIKGFYKGLTLSLLLSSSQVIQMPVYERCKKTYAWLFQSKQKEEDAHTRMIKSLSCGIVSKMATLVFTYPLATLRTRVQQSQKNYLNQQKTLSTATGQPKYTGIMDAAKKLYRFEGISGFYKGFQFNCVKSLPKGIFFLFYELIKTQIPKKNQPQKVQH